ncbi:regulator of G-protein signaling 20 isoform X2 [Mesoplodon densirostris]|nr:regulator of G-protein signaling 20 isoform X2 [Mesoplodon densirostris]XP_059972498.1 regulator of G-protein signaling 20 isoform X2 [Mesoplodon densirostris]XP_059972499.1 regulator of G-protein signaling 20 isoform X2 [Mesoplodon densirostris]XP_059972500.1 regulator of G-protein signaling 20 isoform X2 [Mesoplodon densirostris]
MGSERMEMRKRQVCAAQGPAASAPGQHGVGNRGSNACCFCWCCCCSCSCLTVRNQEEQTLRTASYELRTEDLPTCEESPGPTLEEASAWAQSFDKLMLTPAGRNAFREFLRTEFSEENMLFWMACEELKKEANKTMIEEKARIIYEDYVSILSPKERRCRDGPAEVPHVAEKACGSLSCSRLSGSRGLLWSGMRFVQDEQTSECKEPASPGTSWTPHTLNSFSLSPDQLPPSSPLLYGAGCLGVNPHPAACGILVPRPRLEPTPPALGARSLNHWTAG